MATKLLREMQELGQQPTRFCWNAIINVHARMGITEGNIARAHANIPYRGAVAPHMPETNLVRMLVSQCRRCGYTKLKRCAALKTLHRTVSFTLDLTTPRAGGYA